MRFVLGSCSITGTFPGNRLSTVISLSISVASAVSSLRYIFSDAERFINGCTYAIQAGRELRVIVGADKIDDAETEKLSAEIAKKIQDEMTYPGQVRITVIRETRAVSFAK